ncbi:MAG: phosphate uptake regulator PhoU [Methanobacterium paludis]|nr:phosphate uptake regulator PhoU [Methanobacterium paludis]
MKKKGYPRVLFRKRLNDLKEDVRKMGETTIEAYKNSILVFSSYDEDLVKKVTQAHEKIDKMNYHLEHDAMGVIAAEQPVARDLRFIEACVKVGSHLKRMGNLSFNIAEVARHIKDEEIPQKPMNDLKDMADIVGQTLSHLEQSSHSSGRETSSFIFRPPSAEPFCLSYELLKHLPYPNFSLTFYQVLRAS